MFNIIYKNIGLFLLLYIFPCVAMAQAISGPTCVTAGVSYQYTLTGGGTGFKSYCVTNGTIQPNNTACLGTSATTITVKFNSGESVGYINVTAPAGSVEYEVNIAATMQPGTISGATSQFINFNTAPQAILCSPGSGGCSGSSLSYSWHYSYDQANWNAAGVYTQNYSPGNLTQTTYYRRLTSESTTGQSGYSNIAVVNVYPELKAGTIIPANQIINYNTNAQQLTLTGVTGGTGTYTYEWQRSTDGSNWINIGVNGTVFTPVGITTKTWYRVAVTSNGVTVYSSVAVVDVYPPLMIGSIAPAGQTILVNSVPSPLTITGITGGNGSYTYQWEMSTNNISFTPIGQTNSATYSPGPLSSSVYYRVAVTSNGVTVYSNAIFIDVRPHLTGGTISGSSGPVSYYGSPGLITGSLPTGGVCASYTYQWQYSMDGVAFMDFPNANPNAVNFTPVNLTQNIILKRKVTCGTETAYSNLLSITVNPALYPGLISVNSLIVETGTSPGQLNASPASGGNCASYAYQWEMSYDNISFSPITGATDLYYTPGPIDNKRYFRRKVTCGVDVAYTPVCLIGISTGLSSSNINWIRARDINKPGITDKTTADGLTDKNDVNQVTQYFEGLGKLIQTVSKQESPAGNDMVIPNTYDGAGRESVKYLPFVSGSTDGEYKLGAYTAQQAFNAYLFSGENFYYSQVQYEPSPLNRPIASYDPGNNWVGAARGVQGRYSFNTNADDVKIWQVTNATAVGAKWGSYQKTGEYLPGELLKYVSANEHGKQVIEFKDKKGLVILKKEQLTASADNGNGSSYGGWLCTYYIYDDLDLLRAVIQPKAVELLNGNLNWDVSALNGDILIEQCFRYEYDERRRMIRKQVPGAGEVNMIYDVRDRLVFIQDANMHENNQWLTTLYDNLNRPVITGLMTWTGEAADLQLAVTVQTTNGVIAGLQANRTLFAANTSGTVQATQSITMTDGFSTDPNADFIAEIVQGTPSLESTVEGMTVCRNPIPDGAGFTLLTKTGYDDYVAIPAGSGLTGNIDNTYTTSSYLNTNYTGFPYAEPVVQNLQTQGLVTWTQTKVLGTTSQFLYTVSIYDDKGRIIQVKSKNNTNGVDIATTQYSFNDQPLVSVIKQEKGGSANPQTHIVVSKMEYDHHNRLHSIKKSITSNINGTMVTKPELEIVKNEFDELGQLSKKDVGKKKDANNNYTSDAIQELTYDYNIRGWLLGVNRNYLAIEGQTNDGVLFGYELGYDKTANKAGQAFAKGEYNGNITGMLWKSDGDDIRRKYDFTYDATNRLMGADFTQHNGDDHLWNKSKVDFTVKMGDGTLLSNGNLDPTKAYDANGNIMQMQQWGLKVTGSTQIDDLHYKYYKNDLSNKLQYVTEFANGGTPATGTVTGILGDFADRNNSGNDYGYDLNGNMVTDLNKRIHGTADLDVKTGGAIIYNHLNLPSEIKIKDDNGNDKGTISYVYDATGNKLQKIVLEKNVVITYNNHPYTVDVTTTTTYLGGVYESKAYNNTALASLEYTDKLQFMGHEEGRVRYIPAENSLPAHYEYDYFIKDHLGNVRMVLTEQKEHHGYIATMEHGTGNAVRNQENQLFSNLDVSDYSAEAAGFPSGGSVTEPNLVVAKVNGSGQKKGPAIVLKVMAGDVVDIGVRYFYHSQTGTFVPGNALNDILTSLAGGIISASGVAKGTLAELSDPVTSPLLGALNTFRGDKNQDMPNKPKAYLNWILLDEQFKYVGTFPQSNAMPVGAAEQALPLAYPGIDITKNGYLYIYVSNETENWDVFFDDLAITHHTGPLMEETHYYPFGLTMAGISSKAIGKLENKYKFNEGTELESKEFSDGSGLDLYETKYRSLDPQIGRFWQVDPLSHLSYESSPFGFASNNPILRNDPLGLKDTVVRGQLVQRDKDLAPVEVTAKRPKAHVQVYVWSKEGGLDVGHTAIRINDIVYGYYPTDENGNSGYDKSELFGSKGEMHIDDIPAFNRIYAGQEVTYYQLNLTAKQGAKLKEILEDVAKNPGKYSLLGNNCTSVAMRALNDVGVKLKAYSKFQGMQNLSGAGVTPNDLKVKLESSKTVVTRIVKFIVGQ